MGEIVAGRNPRVPPTTQHAAVGVTVAEFLDRYYTNYVEAQGLRDPVTIKGRLKAIKETLGELPVTALEKRCSSPSMPSEAPPIVNQLSTDWCVLPETQVTAYSGRNE